MVFINFIEQKQLIQFSIALKSSAKSGNSILAEEKNRLLKNLEDNQISVFSYPSRQRTSFDDFETPNSHYTVAANEFDSLSNLAEIALDGFTKNKAKLFFFSQDDQFTYMFVNNSYKEMLTYYHVNPVGVSQDMSFPKQSLGF